MIFSSECVRHMVRENNCGGSLLFFCPGADTIRNTNRYDAVERKERGRGKPGRVEL